MGSTVYIGLGTNLGRREENLEKAIEAMAQLPTVRLLRRSRLYDSAAFGPPQPRYLNAVVELSCGLKPVELLHRLKAIEAALGRVTTERWQPRPIDLDIVLWPGVCLQEGALMVPHPELHKRRFVLEPLCELAPDELHPVLGQSLKALLDGLPPQDLHVLPAPAL